MPPISLMIKPASSNCNLRCHYCFYHALAACREMPSHGIMQIDTLRDVLQKAFAFAKGSPVMISFQGGEPLLAGKAFFRAFADLLPQLNVYGSPVHVGVQTNGTLIDEEWCALFRSGRYLVGVSLDGIRATHAPRTDAEGENTHESVMRAVRLLSAQGVAFNILTVVTKPVVANIETIYAFYKRNNFKHLQFIPCLRPLEEDPALHSDFYINAEDYAEFLKKCFRLYLKDYIEGNYTSIRLFDNLVLLAHGRRAEQCGMNGHCTHQYVIEADGEVYPCDFFCTDRYSLGNIVDTDFVRLEQHPVAVNFITESLAIDDKCRTCRYLHLCRGGCKRERVSLDVCAAYRQFFPLAVQYLERMS